MITLILRLIPVRYVVIPIVAALVLQSLGVDVLGMASDFLLDLLGLSDWSGDWFGGLL